MIWQGGFMFVQETVFTLNKQLKVTLQVEADERGGIIRLNYQFPIVGDKLKIKNDFLDYAYPTFNNEIFTIEADDGLLNKEFNARMIQFAKSDKYDRLMYEYKRLGDMLFDLLRGKEHGQVKTS
jgi:hypothetical protein